MPLELGPSIKVHEYRSLTRNIFSWCSAAILCKVTVDISCYCSRGIWPRTLGHIPFHATRIVPSSLFRPWFNYGWVIRYNWTV